MSGSFDNSGGKMVITNGPRVVSTTQGTLVNLLPTVVSATINVVFPDFTKDYLYNWTHQEDYSNPPAPGASARVAEDNGCTTQQTIVPQEWSDTAAIMVAPAGADFFVGWVRLNRIASPSHSWGGSPIDPLPPTGVWLPLENASILMEAEFGMARAMSLYLDGGNLVRHAQQSVSTAPGGYGPYGDNTGFNWLSPGDTDGGENLFGSAAGIPVQQIDIQNSGYSTYTSPGPTTPRMKQNHRRGGANACSTSLATNFGSTYQVEINGQFGRRS